MTPLRLIIKELWHRKLNALLSSFSLLATVACFVTFFTSAEASRRETVRITRDLGFNLRIIPKQTDMDQFWAAGYSPLTMPEETVGRLARYPNVFFTYNHLVASLQQRFMLAGKEVILTGLSAAIAAPGQQKQPMGYSIKPGALFIGYQVSQRLGLKKGDSLQLGGVKFTIERCLAESGTDDDIHVYGLLSDVQKVLGLPGRINEIKAIDCLCLMADQEPLKILRAELEKALPEAKVIQLRSLADARAKQRQMVEKYFALITPFLLVTCAVWVGVLAVLNVQERRAEIGIMRALGHGSRRVAALFLGKAVVIGIVGAFLGYGLGTGVALLYGPQIFKVTASSLQAEWLLLGQALLAAPLFAAMASFIPAMLAVAQDPATILRETS